MEFGVDISQEEKGEVVFLQLVDNHGDVKCLPRGREWGRTGSERCGNVCSKPVREERRGEPRSGKGGGAHEP